jgi:hypothetical protein
LVRWFVIMIVFFVAGTVLDGLALFSILPESVTSLGGATADIGVASSLLYLLYRGLSPRSLTAQERAHLSSQPFLLAALAIREE